MAGQQAGRPSTSAEPPQRAFNRRLLLGGALAVMAGGSAAACSSSGTSGDTSGSTAVTTPRESARSAAPVVKPGPPAYVPFDSVKADVPGTKEILPGYYHYPKNPPTYLKGPIGSGSTVTALLQGTTPFQPTGNVWLQSLNKAMNIDLKLTQIQAQEYTEKLTVTIAGGDLPDMVQIVNLPSLPQILDKSFVDLSDYLGGDKVKDYPGLAALPPTAWTAGTVNGRLYGIAQPRSIAGHTVMTRQSILDDLGIGEPEISDGKDYLALCKEVTSPKASRWAFGILPTSWLVSLVLEMMGAPNGWEVQAGKFTSAYETDIYPDALDVVRQMWSAGYVHPDSFTSSGSAYLSWWVAGTTVLYPQAFDWWCGYQRLYPDMPIGALVSPKWQGGGDAKMALSAGNYANYVALKKASDARIEELLHVWDYLAAPFGTQEFLDVNYGVLGHDYTLSGSDPVATEIESTEYMYGLIYVGSTGYTVVYVPGNEDIVNKACDFLKRTVPNGVTNPTVGLYSATALGKGVAATTTLTNVASDIIQGRKSVSAWKDAVAAWKKSAGDTISEEYKKSYEESNS